jgi:hypothetical protein
MEAEFRLHMELRAHDLVRGGLTPTEAARRARREFGSTESFKDRGRHARGLRWFDSLRFSMMMPAALSRLEASEELGEARVGPHACGGALSAQDLELWMALAVSALEPLERLGRPTEGVHRERDAG